jgi:hypothetical protein
MMAIYHDAYLFSADDFAKFLREHEKAELEAKVLEYMQDEFVLKLCDNYGSWDYQGVKTYLDEYKEEKSRLTNFEFILFLYKYLSTFSKHPDGLGSLWRVILDEASILENTRRSLVNGQPFDTFVRDWKIHELGVWRALDGEIAPPSTASSLGFMTKEEVLRVQQEILEIKAKLGTDKKELDFALSKSLSMLQSAIENKLGLCLILSG